MPFATQALGRLSSLAVWWIRLGILPDLIEPGSPHQNGRHERMHLTLKRECTRPPQAHPGAATTPLRSLAPRVQHAPAPRGARRCDPGVGLHPLTPALSSPPPPLEYPGHYEVRRVSRNGGIRWHKQWVNVSQTLGEEYVGLVEIDDGEWDVYFGPLRLGRFHERTLLIEDALGRHYRRRY